jgi:hypothetical protein
VHHAARPSGEDSMFDACVLYGYNFPSHRAKEIQDSAANRRKAIGARSRKGMGCRQDIPALVEHFLNRVGRKASITPQALALLDESHWPGNVRELENAIERAVVLAPEGVVTKAEIQLHPASQRIGAHWTDQAPLEIGWQANGTQGAKHTGSPVTPVRICHSSIAEERAVAMVCPLSLLLTIRMSGIFFLLTIKRSEAVL